MFVCNGPNAHVHLTVHWPQHLAVLSANRRHCYLLNRMDWSSHCHQATSIHLRHRPTSLHKFLLLYCTASVISLSSVGLFYYVTDRCKLWAVCWRLLGTSCRRRKLHRYNYQNCVWCVGHADAFLVLAVLWSFFVFSFFTLSSEAECWSLAGELSLSCARPAADG